MTRTDLLREEPAAVPAAVDGVIAVRGPVSEVELDALLVHAAEQLVLAVLRHRQLLQAHNLKKKERKKENTGHRMRACVGVSSEWMDESDVTTLGSTAVVPAVLNEHYAQALMATSKRSGESIATRTCYIYTKHCDAAPNARHTTNEACVTLKGKKKIRKERKTFANSLTFRPPKPWSAKPQSTVFLVRTMDRSPRWFSG